MERLEQQISIFDKNIEDEELFRPIHYLGSKLRMLKIIDHISSDIDPDNGIFVDLFAGSGTVSNYMGKKRNIISVDIQNYSNVICDALLRTNITKDNVLKQKKSIINYYKNNISRKFFLELIDYEKQALELADVNGDYSRIVDVLENGTIVGYENGYSKPQNRRLQLLMDNIISEIDKGNVNNINTMVLRYFGGTYFSYEQAIGIDILLEYIHTNIEAEYRNFYIACVLSTASEIVNTIGKQFAQPIRPRDSRGNIKKNLVQVLKRDRQIDLIDVYTRFLFEYYDNKNFSSDNIVINGDVLDVMNNLEDDVSIIYADPPYTRYHYSRYYHVLETISLRDLPEITKIKENGRETLTRGLYRKDRHQSQFSIKSKAYDSFIKLFETVSKKDVPFILSYSPYDNSSKTAPRMVTLKDLENIANNYYSNVEIILIDDFNHTKLNNKKNNIDGDVGSAEMLIICR